MTNLSIVCVIAFALFTVIQNVVTLFARIKVSACHTQVDTAITNRRWLMIPPIHQQQVDYEKWKRRWDVGYWFILVVCAAGFVCSLTIDFPY